MSTFRNIYGPYKTELDILDHREGIRLAQEVDKILHQFQNEDKLIVSVGASSPTPATLTKLVLLISTYLGNHSTVCIQVHIEYND